MSISSRAVHSRSLSSDGATAEPLLQQAANCTGRAVKRLSPIHDPEEVAEVIVCCAERPEREVDQQHVAEKLLQEKDRDVRDQERLRDRGKLAHVVGGVEVLNGVEVAGRPSGIESGPSCPA